ncbi:MAG TPA: PHP domain-containing protein [Candidatus Cloacimonas sp.]|jgi:PHP family Zn ribbon phosphoesterase|nr:PHP domain-containing protein [Candidatus Cloacimonas sp.]HNS83948.1 PHP domain-containing protein [Candidatus Cloacimonas sp.]HPA24157.1 PHP domain-containing protein [Candidatus Cloacimonas sp.]HQM03188.1 PHP domain-containing protein [Candidatus Cloacimonas sp.]
MLSLHADLHIHSVLSPCGGLEMSPNSIMQRLKQFGIQWLAITDHNSMANCPAYQKVAEKEGLFFTWGIEIQSVEEIHLLAYFDDSSAAEKFNTELYNSLFPLDNDPDFFGDQVIIDENENILRMEPRALINSSQWNLNTVVEKVEAYNGLVIPAHIDSSTNSILSQLGFMPKVPQFQLFGISACLDVKSWVKENPYFQDKVFLRASDAHYLSDIGKGYSIITVEEPSVQELFLAAKGCGRRKIEI